MPVECGQDASGHFCRWGKSGKRYPFDPQSETSKRRARARAAAQGRAVRASGYSGGDDAE